MNNELRNKISNEEQQIYISSEFELKELERKTKVEDAEYQNMLSEIMKNNDPVQIAAFNNDYISQSEYERKVSQNRARMNEIDEKYGISVDRKKEEIKIDAIRKRQQLARLKNYYERINSTVMRNVDISALSDEEVINEFNRITAGIEHEKLSEMLNSDITSRLKDRIEDGKTNGKKHGKDNEIEKELENFRNGVEKIKGKFNDCQFKLVLGEVDLEFNDVIRGLGEEVSELHNEAENIIRDMDEFREATMQSDFSMTVPEIRRTIKDLKTRLKNLKQIQIDKYNARVYNVNKIISELKAEYLNDEEINNLMLLDTCDVKIGEWRNFKYLDKIDYDKLIEVSNKIKAIKARTKTGDGTKTGDDETFDFESDMLWVEYEIEVIDSQIKDVMPKEMLNQLNENISFVADRINELKVKLEMFKDSLSEEEYNDYFDRLNDAEANLADLNTKLKKTVTSVKESVYDKLSQELENVSRDVVNFSNFVSSLSGHVLESAIPVFEGKLAAFEAILAEFKEEIEKEYKDGNLQENQYNELIKKVTVIEKQLLEVREKIKDPMFVKDGDIFAILNGQIDGLEAAVEKLEEQVNELEEPIKNKETRRNIEGIIGRLEAEAAFIEKNLEYHKDKDPEKYEAAMERLNAVKERLAKVSKNYRKKCPLLVRVVKSAKDFYKKHKKLCLIIAGLSAIALIHATVGPILIPAIMHGNIMIGAETHTLAGFTSFVNNVLGGLINAKNVNGLWYLANGVRINNGLAGASLLKGVAISGIGSAALVAPVVVAIKKLIDKMKNVELKKKLSEKFEKEKIANMKKKLLEEKERLKAKRKEIAKTAKKVKNPEKKVMGQFYDKYLKLLNEYHNSGQSFEDFCVQNELSEEDMAILNYLSNASKEVVNNSRGGRK